MNFSRRAKRTFVFFLLLGLLFCYLGTRGDRENAYFFERWTYHLLLPPTRVARSFGSFFTGSYHQVISLYHARKQNVELSAQVQSLQQRLLKAEEEFLNYQRTLGHLSKLNLEMGEVLVARVVAYDPLSTVKSVYINVGSEDGVRPNQVVLAQGALVGRIAKVTEKTSQVLLITDLHSAVGVIDAKTRARGILKGLRQELVLRREGYLTQAEYISRQEKIDVGDFLMTSGMDAVFSKGIPVGKVTKIKKSIDGLFWEAEVMPLVEMNQLEEVLVLKTSSQEEPLI